MHISHNIAATNGVALTPSLIVSPHVICLLLAACSGRLVVVVVDILDICDKGNYLVFLPCDALRCTVFVIVILSVCPSVCHTRALCPRGSTYDHDFFTIW